MFKEIEKKAFVVQEEYKKTQEVFVPLHCTPGWPPIYLRFLIRISLFVFTQMIDNHKVELDKTKEEYTNKASRTGLTNPDAKSWLLIDRLDEP